MTHGPWPALGFQAEFDVLVFVFVMAWNGATEIKAERIFWHKAAVAASFFALTKVEGQEQQEPGQYGPHLTVFAWPSADPAAVVRYHSSTSSASDGSERR